VAQQGLDIESLKEVAAKQLDHRPGCLDLQKHDSLAERTANKSMMFIKANGVIINGVGDDSPHTSDLRYLKTSSYAVGQKIRSQSFALVLSIDG
jgi:hypothetical protein